MTHAKRYGAALTLSALGAWATLAQAAGFEGALAPANFSSVNTGVIVGASPVAGTALFTATQLTLTGSNAISPQPATDATACTGGVYAVLTSPCELRSTASFAGQVSFSWSYTSSDRDGPPSDIFGVIVDGAHIALSAPGGAITQSGTRSVSSTSSIGWFINCTDCINGAATAVVSNVSAVPEPAALALWLAGLGGLRVFSSRARRGLAAAAPAAPAR